jgi:hypothetical protein
MAGRPREVAVPAELNEYVDRQLRKRRRERNTEWPLLGTLREKVLVREYASGPGVLVRVYRQRIGLR